MENQHNTIAAELAILQSSIADCPARRALTAANLVLQRKRILLDLLETTIREELTKAYQDEKAASMRLEFSRKLLHSGSFVTIPMIDIFLDSYGCNFDIKSLDPSKMTQEACDMLVDIIKFFESLRLHELSLRAMTRCLIALNTFPSLKVESSDSKANIQEIKAKIQDKFNYNGNCNVKIGIIPERSGTPFLKMGVLRPTPMVQKVHSTQLVLRLTGAKHMRVLTKICMLPLRRTDTPRIHFLDVVVGQCVSAFKCLIWDFIYYNLCWSARDSTKICMPSLRTSSRHLTTNRMPTS